MDLDIFPVTESLIFGSGIGGGAALSADDDLNAGYIRKGNDMIKSGSIAIALFAADLESTIDETEQ